MPRPIEIPPIARDVAICFARYYAFQWTRDTEAILPPKASRLHDSVHLGGVLIFIGKIQSTALDFAAILAGAYALPPTELIPF